jgi:hypothetical protein
MRQVGGGERREEHIDRKDVVSFFWKRVSDNHYLDCEKMILIGAVISGSVNVPPVIHRQLPPTSSQG